MTFEEVKAQRIIEITNLSLVCKESLENSFVVYCGTTRMPYLVNGYGWTENMRRDFINKLVAELQTEPFEIVQNENIYFVKAVKR